MFIVLSCSYSYCAVGSGTKVHVSHFSLTHHRIPRKNQAEEEKRKQMAFRQNSPLRYFQSRYNASLYLLSSVWEKKSGRVRSQQNERSNTEVVDAQNYPLRVIEVQNRESTDEQTSCPDTREHFQHWVQSKDTCHLPQHSSCWSNNQVKLKKLKKREHNEGNHSQ